MQTLITDAFLHAELPARLGWRIVFGGIIFDDPPYLLLRAIPVFPGCSPRLQDEPIVWDIFSLIDSVQRPGAHQVLTCSCGYAPDADLEKPVLVSHPDAEIVVWELDIAGLRPALDQRFAQVERGFVRLVFSRDEYEADIRKLLRELQRSASTSVDKNDLRDVPNLHHLIDDYSDLTMVQVEELEPNTRGGMALERLLALDAEGVWTRQAL